MRAFDDGQERNIGRGELQAELNEERELRKKAEIERDSFRGLVVEALGERNSSTPKRHLRAV